MVTMKEIAEKAGVSQPTVSRVINGESSVNPELRKRVMKWVKKLDYEPNKTARSLVDKKSHLIGVIIPNISNPYFSTIIQMVEKEADTHGYNIILCNTNYDINQEKKYLKTLRSRQVDGILLTPIKVNASHVKSIKNHKIPVVILTKNSSNFDSVSVSHIKGGKIIAEHLLDLGHVDIGFIGDVEDNKYIGFKNELEKNHVFLNKNNIIRGTFTSSHEVYDLMKEFIASWEGAQPISALFGYNDIAAFGALHACQDYGISVPEEIGIVGFDNTFLATESRPKLTSVSQPTKEIGRLSVEILINKIVDEVNNEQEEYLLEPRLIARESTRILYK